MYRKINRCTKTSLLQPNVSTDTVTKNTAADLVFGGRPFPRRGLSNTKRTTISAFASSACDRKWFRHIFRLFRKRLGINIKRLKLLLKPVMYPETFYSRKMPLAYSTQVQSIGPGRVYKRDYGRRLLQGRRTVSRTHAYQQLQSISSLDAS